MMIIKASYHDGFTGRLLRWKLVVNNGKAYLEADWFMNKSPVRAKFRFNEESFRSALPLISGMDEEYQSLFSDQEDYDLLVTDGDTSIHHHVYGAWMIAHQQPHVRNFLEVWKLLDDAVSAHLPKT